MRLQIYSNIVFLKPQNSLITEALLPPSQVFLSELQVLLALDGLLLETPTSSVLRQAGSVAVFSSSDSNTCGCHSIDVSPVSAYAVVFAQQAADRRPIYNESYLRWHSVVAKQVLSGPISHDTAIQNRAMPFQGSLALPQNCAIPPFVYLISRRHICAIPILQRIAR